MIKVGFIVKLIGGTMGQKIVAKHNGYGMMLTHYPDMSLVCTSEDQWVCVTVFNEEIAFTRSVYSNPAYEEKYRERQGSSSKRLFQDIIKDDMRQATNESMVGHCHTSKSRAPIDAGNNSSGLLTPIRKGKRQNFSCKILDTLWMSIPDRSYWSSVAVGRRCLLLFSFPRGCSPYDLEEQSTLQKTQRKFKLDAGV